MKRAVLVICDGLRADMLRPAWTPNLCQLAARSRQFMAHRSVFPSTTRVTSASIATGCHPGRHGLEGNAVALDEGEGLVPLSAGTLGFRERLKKVTGQTLKVPTLAERLVETGGSIVFSNVSPGAAYFQDPDGHGHVYHQAGSFGPGLIPINGDDHLDVTHNACGDKAMTERFCNEVLKQRQPALSVLWQCEPDHSQHSYPLGSPPHLAAIAAADSNAGRIAETIQSLNEDGDDILLILASDHGHETVGTVVDLDSILINAGFKAGSESRDCVITSQGFSALIYLDASKQKQTADIATFLNDQEGIGTVYYGSALAAIGHRTDGALAIAVDAVKSDDPNSFGIPGISSAFFNQFSMTLKTGNGEHGGLGRYEQNPFLIIHGGNFEPGTASHAPSSAVDIAPTILSHLELAPDGMDGKTLK